MSGIENIATAPAVAMVDALANKKISAVELTDAVIDLIEARDGPINAVVVRDFARARDAARTADAALSRGERRPLLGLPMTVKEAVNVAGLPTTWGVELFKGWIASEDAVVVQRLKAAGAVIVGKTNVAPWLADWQSNNSVYGRTNNPWDLSRTSGGSSGGAAAALASGMTPLECGSDLAGSLRVPAALCGVYGHKSSYNLVPMRGFSPPGIVGADIPLAVLGPMARTPADLDLSLTVLAGPTGQEAVGYRVELPGPRHSRLSDYRVLILDEHPNVEVDDEIRGALHSVAKDLSKLGAQVERRSDLLPDISAAVQIFVDMLGVITSRRGPPQDDQPSAHDWMDLLDSQLVFRNRWASLFDVFDVVLAPTFGSVAFPHMVGETFGHNLSINGRATPYVAQGAWSSMATLANLPSTAAPIGWTAHGLPIGAQIIGPYLEDRTTIGFAALLEREFGGFRAPPSSNDGPLRDQDAA
jgi:amidase